MFLKNIDIFRIITKNIYFYKKKNSTGTNEERAQKEWYRKKLPNVRFVFL